MLNIQYKRLFMLTITLIILVMSPITINAQEDKSVKRYEPQRRAWFMTKQGRYMSDQDRVRKGFVNPKDITSESYRKEFTKPDEKGEVIFNSESPYFNEDNKIYEPVEKIEKIESGDKNLDLENDALGNLNDKKEKAPVKKKEEIKQEKIKDTGIPVSISIILGLSVIVILVAVFFYINKKRIKEDEEKERFKETSLEESLYEIDREEYTNDLDNFNYNDYLEEHTNESDEQQDYSDYNDYDYYINSDLDR